MADGGFMDFLGSLLKPFQEGAQSTMDAATDDWDKITSGRTPQHLVKDAKGLMAMSGTGQLAQGMGPGMPKLPAYMTGQSRFDPKKGWEFIKEAEYPSVDPLKSILQGNVLGADFSELLMKLLQNNRVLTKGSPLQW